MNATPAPDAAPSSPVSSTRSERGSNPVPPDAPRANRREDGTRDHRVLPCSFEENKRLKSIALLARESYDAVYGAKERAALAGLVTFVAPRVDNLDALLPGAVFPEVEAIFSGWHAPKIDGAALTAFPALRVIFHAGGSVKFLVTDEVWDRGVRLTSATQANAVPVGEYTLAHLILGLKGVLAAARATRDARSFVRNDFASATAFGGTVGILSLGTIGRIVASHLQRLDVRVLAYDPYVSTADASSLGVELCSLEEVFARSHAVTCHTPLLGNTVHLLRERHFASMPPHATFINTARGAIVHEPELIAVLQRRPDLFAVLDVTDPEPPPPDSPLYSLPNVLLTPHLSGSIGPECRRMGQMMVDEVSRYLAGEPLQGEVTRDQLAMLA